MYVKFFQAFNFLKLFILFPGCFKFNFPLVTIYTNLGESGVQYGISQTKAEHVLVSQVSITLFLGLYLLTTIQPSSCLDLRCVR